MARVLSVVFLLIVFQYSYGQENKLKGRIIADSLEGYAINIINYTKKIGTTNTKEGYFEIPSEVNDSIIFSSVQYEVKTHVVSESDLIISDFRIELTPELTELAQVNISNYKLTGDIEKDVKHIKIKPYLGMGVLGFSETNKKPLTIEQRKIYTAKSGPLDLLINSLNGNLKKLKKNKELKELDDLIRKGENSFNSLFFVEHVGIPENLINDFVYFCSYDDSYKMILNQKDKLKLAVFFKQKSVDYKEFKKID